MNTQRKIDDSSDSLYVIGVYSKHSVYLLLISEFDSCNSHI